MRQEPYAQIRGGRLARQQRPLVVGSFTGNLTSLHSPPDDMVCNIPIGLSLLPSPMFSCVSRVSVSRCALFAASLINSGCLQLLQHRFTISRYRRRVGYTPEHGSVRLNIHQIQYTMQSRIHIIITVRGTLRI